MPQKRKAVFREIPPPNAMERDQLQVWYGDDIGGKLASYAMFIECFPNAQGLKEHAAPPYYTMLHAGYFKPGFHPSDTDRIALREEVLQPLFAGLRDRSLQERGLAAFVTDVARNLLDVSGALVLRSAWMRKEVRAFAKRRASESLMARLTSTLLKGMLDRCFFVHSAGDVHWLEALPSLRFNLQRRLTRPRVVFTVRQHKHRAVVAVRAQKRRQQAARGGGAPRVLPFIDGVEEDLNALAGVYLMPYIDPVRKTTQARAKEQLWSLLFRNAHEASLDDERGPLHVLHVAYENVAHFVRRAPAEVFATREGRSLLLELLNDQDRRPTRFHGSRLWVPDEDEDEEEPRPADACDDAMFVTRLLLRELATSAFSVVVEDHTPRYGVPL